jgi:3-phosphoshikimate 1-carboxyvinyltransferase
MGVSIEETQPGELRVGGVGVTGLRAPGEPIDCGNSGTTMRLLAGLLVAQPFASTLVGDDSLSRRPMMRVIAPLSRRGARIDGDAHPTKAGERTAPLRIQARGSRLGSVEHESDVPSAQVKSALLLSGLDADGPTFFREPMLSRDHTERMLRALGAPIETMASCVVLDPRGWDQRLAPFDLKVPGDLSAAAFLLAAAFLVPGSEVSVRDVGVNPTRTGFLDIARGMGATFHIEPSEERGGEPLGALHASSSELVSTKLGGEVVTRAIDEIPIACALFARAHGVSRVEGAAELRVKESDRIAAMVHVLRAFGVEADELPDGVVVEGTDKPLRAAEIESRGDHRVAMTAAVLGLLAKGVTRIHDVDCIGTSFPRFVGTLRALGARIDVE